MSISQSKNVTVNMIFMLYIDLSRIRSFLSVSAKLFGSGTLKQNNFFFILVSSYVFPVSPCQITMALVLF